jgi:hypothetical protein
MTFETINFSDPMSGRLLSREEKDPRLAIARHMGWAKDYGPVTPWPCPEPDNYNRGLFASKPLFCSFIKDQIWYKTRHGWWSISYVLDNDFLAYDSWAKMQNIEIFWQHAKAPPLKPVRKMLYARKNAVELTTNEMLNHMGYYEKLSVKYFADKQEVLQQRLGVARALPANVLVRLACEELEEED